MIRSESRPRNEVDICTDECYLHGKPAQHMTYPTSKQAQPMTQINIKTSAAHDVTNNKTKAAAAV